MRELKFRAWDKENDVMLGADVNDYEFHTRYDHEKGTMVGAVDCEDGQVLRSREVELMQYTGLKDRNGKEIYEGDIIKVDNTDKVIMWMRGNICLVKYLPGRFKLENRIGDGNMMQEDMQDIIEVIGNIYEHPHLLGV